MRREIPSCVLGPLRLAKLRYRLGGLLGACPQAVGYWIRVGRVPDAYWQDFMAHAIALLEVLPMLPALQRSMGYRERHRRFEREWRAKLSPGERLRWRNRHNAWRRERYQQMRRPTLCEALRCERV